MSDSGPSVARPRFLARAMGYTQDPRRAIDDLCALDDADLERLARPASRPAATDRQLQPIAVRLARAQAQARLTRVDIRPQVFALRRTMNARRSQVAIEARMVAIERKIFPTERFPSDGVQ